MAETETIDKGAVINRFFEKSEGIPHKTLEQWFRETLIANSIFDQQQSNEEREVGKQKHEYLLIEKLKEGKTYNAFFPTAINLVAVGMLGTAGASGLINQNRITPAQQEKLTQLSKGVELGNKPFEDYNQGQRSGHATNAQIFIAEKSSSEQRKHDLAQKREQDLRAEEKREEAASGAKMQTANMH